jgi:DNA-binding winged helix-turn-helix (wHTH) protein
VSKRTAGLVVAAPRCKMPSSRCAPGPHSCSGPFRLDTAGSQLWRGSELIPLPPKSFDLLEYLADNQGELKTREELFSALWPDTIVDDHALSVQIREIRKALRDDAHQPTYIETRHRRGYCFRAQVTRAVHTAALGYGGSPLPAAAPPDPVTSARTAPARARPIRTDHPETRYASSGDVNIAYQVIGDGPVDLVFVMGWVSHLEYFWTEPRFARFLRRLASFSRVILFDKRGTGLSDRVPVDQLPAIEQRMQHLHAVMQATGSERAVICGVSEGGCMSAGFRGNVSRANTCAGHGRQLCPAPPCARLPVGPRPGNPRAVPARNPGTLGRSGGD